MSEAILVDAGGLFGPPGARQGAVLHLMGSVLCLALLLPASSHAQTAVGSACGMNADCVSNNCVDAICCPSSCFQACYSCASAVTGMADGTCAQVEYGKQTTNMCNTGGQACNKGSCLPQHCFNNKQDEDETDKDCGGSCLNTCATGGMCKTNADCVTNNCVDGICCPGSCFTTCTSCALATTGQADPTMCYHVQPNQQTTNGCSKTDLACNGSVGDQACVPKTCLNGMKDPGETDVDCGGSCGPTCNLGQVCTTNSDCLTANCIDGICCGPGCFGDCRSCAMATTKLADGTCGQVLDMNHTTSCAGNQQCSNGKCVPDNCFNGKKDGDETDVDCGGSCAGCSQGQTCNLTSDCAGPPQQPQYANCVDGVCCGKDCYQKTCQSCAMAKTGPGNPDGTCAQVITGEQTTNGCNGMGQSCDDMGNCSGSPTPTGTVTGNVSPTATDTPQTPATPGSTPTPTATTPPGLCVGDCNGDGSVSVDELITMGSIALGNEAVADCPRGDRNNDSEITIDEIVTASQNSVNGCSAGLPPTATPTSGATATATP